MKKKLIINTIIVIIIALLSVIFGYIFVFSKSRGKDSFSKAVVKETRGIVTFEDVVIDSNENEVHYYFLNQSWNSDMISIFIESINSNSILIEGKASVSLFAGDGIKGRVFTVYNYYENQNGLIMYDGFYRAYRTDVWKDSDMWGDPLFYTEIFNDLKVFEIPEEFQKKAEEENINWYEVWPGLEEVIVDE